MAFGPTGPALPNVEVPNPQDLVSGFIAGILGNAHPPVPSVPNFFGNLPWAVVNQPSGSSATPLVNSPFFKYLAPNGYLWDKLLPYRLIVWDTVKNQVVGGDKPQPIQVTPLGNGTLSLYPLSTAWEFHLPITPQQLNITDNYAINTSATLRGILEEHSGVRFKNIVIQGTFGVWPGRPSIVKPPGTPGVLQSLLGGTIAAAQNVVGQFQSVVNAALTGTAASKPTTITPGAPTDDEKGLGTGYYQTIMLQQFLEQYAEAKRNPDNAGWRLVFDIPKQNQSFVVTPIAFTWNENVNKPMEINYNLQLKAWRRIDLKDSFVPTPLSNTQLSPGVLQGILNTISAAQNTAAAAYALIGAVRSDVDNILNVIRQTGLFVKDLAGVAVAASDLPSQLISDTQSTISGFLASTDLNTLTASAATLTSVTNQIKALQLSSSTNEGLSSQAVSSGQIGPSASSAQTVNPANNIYQKPQTNPQLFSQVPVNSLTLNAAQQNAYDIEIANVSSFTVEDLKTMRGTILTMVTQLESFFGGGDAYYSKIFNTPFMPNTSNQIISLDQYSILQDFYELLQSYDILTATQQLDSQDTLNNMEYVQSLAQISDIPFTITNSKIQVPVPYGLSVEGIALRYLGDAQRWLEIVTLNFLREPYIDENGFTYNLLSNGDGRNVVVGDNTNLYPGQLVSINSSVQNPTTRTILDIVALSQTSFLLTLDGDIENDLNIYKIADGAYLKSYLPGTVNSSNVIFVPSDVQTPAYDQISIPTSVANIDLVGLSKVDWLLIPNAQGNGADIAVTSSGDFRLAAGIVNLQQALTTMMSTSINTSYANPSFGLSFRVGSSIADFKAQDIYNEITNLITSDSRFSGVSGLQINQQGSALSINLAVGLSGVQGIFPISYQLGNQ